MSTDTGKGTKRVMVSLRFTTVQARWLEEAAAISGRSVSALVRQAVGRYMFELIETEAEDDE